MSSSCSSLLLNSHSRHIYPVIIPAWGRFHHLNIKLHSKSRIPCSSYAQWCRKGKRASQSWNLWAVNIEKNTSELDEEVEEPISKVSKKKGTIVGAVALIISSNIGIGILALPKTTSPAGLFPSSVSMATCWIFLLIEALVLVEINVGLLRKKKERAEENELGIISIRTMAQETLGELGGAVATITYVFLGYTNIVAHSSKSGEILYHLTSLSEPISGFMFTALFATLISVGGTRTTDQVNQWLTSFMIGLLVSIEVVAVVSEGWSGWQGTSNWGSVPATIPVMIFALAYHDITPVICAYLGGDIRRIRASVLLGSFIPLLALLVWNAVALGLSAQSDHLVDDPVELLLSVQWSGIPAMVEAFSVLAVGASLIASLLSFSEFFKEQLSNMSRPSPPSDTKQNGDHGLGQWWGRNKVGFAAMSMAVGPPLLVSTTFPDAFSAATDIAGGYCMTMLYGILPPAMAWAMHSRESKGTGMKAISRIRPALVGIGLFAFGIVVEQILQDLSMLHS